MSYRLSTQIPLGTDTRLSSQSELSSQISSFYRERYELSCWKDAEGNVYDNDGIINISADTVISAQWIGRKYNVTLDKNGGTCTDLSSYRYTEGAILPTDWTRQGYVFVGWQDGSGKTVTEISADEYGDKQFTAIANPKKMVVTYHTNWE